MVPAEVAIPRLIDLHGGSLFGLGLRLCGKPEEAEDLVQETFLRAFRAWDQFEGRSDPKTWLYSIAARVCQRLHRLRSGQPRKMQSLESLLPFGEATLGVARAPAAEGLEAQIRPEDRARLEQAITELPIAFRLPVVLKEVVGLSIADVAEILGLKPATVKTRVHRARLRLRQALEEDLPRAPFPAAAYSRQVCLDLLAAKQEALDRGVDMPREVVCGRCQAVFETLDLTQDACRLIGEGELPPAVREMLMASIAR
jgi:RNA polymerase sigma-70 factor (ECF subfamily)